MDKKTVLETYFHNKPEHPSDAYNQGFGLYKQTPGKNNNIERSLNSGGYTPSNLETLEYELKRLHGITDLEAIPPVVELIEPSLVEKLAAAIRETGNKDFLLAIKTGRVYKIEIFLLFEDNFSAELKAYLDKQEASLQALNDLVENVVGHTGEDFSEEDFATLIEILKPDLDTVEFPENIKSELDELAAKYPDDDEDENPLDMLINAKAAIEELAKIEPNTDTAAANQDQTTTTEETPEKIRDEYPFLDSPDCPDELKILVADKISSYRRYKEAHTQLAKFAAGEITLTEEEQLALAATATSNFANSEAIATELNYYAENGKILAQHPTLVNIALKNEVDKLTNTQLMNLIKDKSFFTRKNQAIAAAKTEAEKAKLQLEIDHRNLKIKLAKEKLGISD